MKYCVNLVQNGKIVLTGGFADRLKGMISCYWLSKILDEDLTVDWSTPTPLDSCYEYLDIQKPSATPAAFQSQVDNYTHLNLVGKQYTLFKESFLPNLNKCNSKNSAIELIKNTFSHYDSIYTNNPLDFLIQSQILKDILQTNYDFRIDNFSDLMFHGYRRTIRLKENFLLAKELKRLEDYFGDVDIDKRLAVHVRVGGDHVSWQDPVLDDPDAIYSKLKLLIGSRCFVDSRVFVCSDSTSVKENIIEILTDAKIDVFTHSLTPSHTERSASSIDDFATTVLDFESLRLAGLILHGQGAFSRIASFTSGNKLQYIHK